MDDVVFNFKMYGHDDENSFVVILVMLISSSIFAALYAQWTVI